MADEETKTIDVFKELPYAAFRGIQFPIIARGPVGHSHTTIKHGLQYRDKQIVETTGAENLTLTYTIPFRQGLATGPWENAFHELYSQLWDEYLDKTPGDLIDPFRGQLIVIPGSWDEEVDVDKRDGLDVRLTFIEAPLDDEEPLSLPTIQGAYSEAGALDTEVEKVDWEQEQSPQPTQDPLSAVRGIGDQLDVARSRIAASLDDVAYRCERLEATAERLEDPERTQRVVRSARRLNLATRRLNSRAMNPAKSAKRVLNATARTISAVAADMGTTIEALLRANPALNGPLVPGGLWLVQP